MTKHTKIITTSILFLVVFIVDIWAVQTKNKEAIMLFKPLLMTTLAAIYLVAVNKPNFWYVSALFFSFWGDVLLFFNTQYFVHGLASFLFVHILYIKISAGYLEKVSIKKIAVTSFPFVIFFFALLTLIFDHLGAMKIPVIFYGLTISSFGAVTLLNYVSEKSTANLWLFLGAILFILSDSLLAINKFYQAKEIYGISIMITYVVAQYLICKSMIVRNDN